MSRGCTKHWVSITISIRNILGIKIFLIRSWKDDWIGKSINYFFRRRKVKITNGTIQHHMFNLMHVSRMIANIIMLYFLLMMMVVQKESMYFFKHRRIQ